MFGRLAAVRGKDVDPEKKEAVSELRNRVKDGVKKMKALYVPEDPERIYGDLLNSREPVLMLLELAEEFTARFQEAKEEKNLVDFNDLEHFALDILTAGSRDHSPGPAADELAGLYEEILVDEYQDSNEVQETLIRADLQGAVREAQRVHGGGCEAEHLQIPPGKTGTFYGEI